MRSMILLLTFMLAGSAFSKEYWCWVGGEVQGKEFEVPDLKVDENESDHHLAEQSFQNYKFRLQYTPANSRLPYPAKLILTISKEEDERSLVLFSAIWLEGYAKVFLSNEEGYVDFKCFLNQG